MATDAEAHPSHLLVSPAFAILAEAVWVLFAGGGISTWGVARAFEVERLAENRGPALKLLQRHHPQYWPRAQVCPDAYYLDTGTSACVGWFCSPPCTNIAGVGDGHGPEWVDGESIKWRFILGLAQRRYAAGFPVPFVVIETLREAAHAQLRSDVVAKRKKVGENVQSIYPDYREDDFEGKYRQPCLVGEVARSFAALGYSCSWRVLSACPFAGGLKRDRLYILLTRPEAGFDPRVLLKDSICPEAERRAEGTYSAVNDKFLLLNTSRSKRPQIASFLRGVTT